MAGACPSAAQVPEPRPAADAERAPCLHGVPRGAGTPHCIPGGGTPRRAPCYTGRVETSRRIGWTTKRSTGSHRVLERAGWPDVVFAFHDGEEIGPRMLARIGRLTGLTPEEL